LEGALSIDNALALGLLAKRLPRELRAKALNIGMMLAFIFRFIAIFTAALLIRFTVVKLLGGGYLVYISVKHLLFESGHAEEGKIELDAYGNPIVLDEPTEADIKAQTAKPATARFWPTVISIGLTDIAFAVDSILAAIALVGTPLDPNDYHPKLWVVFMGGGLGMIALRFAAGVFVRMLERFPRFETSAYLLVLVIGLKLLGDWGLNSNWNSYGLPMSWEHSRQGWAASYDKWLEEKWIFKIRPHHAEPPPGANAAHPPHVLNFHDLRRPEAIAFWVLMVGAFSTGFVPPRKKRDVDN